MLVAAVGVEGLLGGAGLAVGGGQRLVLRGRLPQALGAVAVDDHHQQGQHGQAGQGDQRRHDQDFARACPPEI